MAEERHTSGPQDAQDGTQADKDKTDDLDDFTRELLGSLHPRRDGAEAGAGAGADTDDPGEGDHRPLIEYAEQAVMEGDEREKVSVDSVPLATAWLRAETGTDGLAHLYRQYGRLVRVTESAVESIGADELAAEVNFRYSCLKQRKEELIPAMFPEQAAKQAVNAAYLLPNVRDIRGVIETPVFRPDGSLIAESGYDDATQLLYRPRQPITLEVPDEPSAEAVAEAVLVLNFPVSAFPFVRDADRANWFGLVLTPLLSQIVPGPYKLGLITANQQGSGKTFLAEIIRTLYGGPFHASYPRNPEEFSKLVTSDLTHTTGLAPVFDNVTGTIKGGEIAALLTSRTWAARILGRTATVEAENNRLWLATGNNVTVDDDMARRVLSVRIETTEEHPENREFDLDPVHWVREHRAAYLSAAATLVRAWFASGGALADRSASGDIYHAWRQAIAGILAHAGVPGGFDGAETRVACGTGKDEWGTFLIALRERYADGEWTAKDAANAIQAGFVDLDSLPGQLAERAFKPTLSWSLGRWLMNRDQTVAQGLKAVNAGKDRTNKTLWRIEEISPA